ncbi:MAG: peptide methionine sulfoxide reductase msrA/msrB [Candidatus Paceibacteria bacterium]|jgi:peptide methionine sulfoxide reductase msrA/msrB
MDFLSGLLMVIGGWFGFGVTPAAEVVSEPIVEVVEQTTDLVEGLQVPLPKEMAPEAVESDSQESPETEAVSEAETEVVDAMMDASEPVVLPVNTQTAIVAGGCFWCVEADLEKTSGVIGVVSGYAGGSTDNPTYQNYGSGGHREVVEVTYDANRVSFEDVLIVTLKTTDPTDDEGTFGDRGDKYSSAFYYETAAQKTIIENLIAEVDENGPYTSPLAIDIEARPKFWAAEDNHQDYYKGILTKLKYQFYRNGSGRTAFIEKHWGTDTGPNLPWRNESNTNNTTNSTTMNDTTYPWNNYSKPDREILEATMEATAFRVTQKDGTERAGTSELDKIYDRGIFVDVLSGEPLYSSRDKFDSGTGWPSFTAPITSGALTLHEDRKLFSVRTETRSTIADNHIGHVFNDGPADKGGLRYCMNGAALRFVPEADMAVEGYTDFLKFL